MNKFKTKRTFLFCRRELDRTSTLFTAWAEREN
jgi:hypothetical protein